MFARLKNWLTDKFAAGETTSASRSTRSATHARAQPIKNTKLKAARSANPDHAADSLPDPDEDAGIDPYNTGRFDRSRNWNNRYRK